VRVCLLAPEFLPVWGGVGTYSFELAKELSRWVDLTILAPTRVRGNEAFGPEDLQEMLGNRADVLTISNAHDTFMYNANFQVAVLRTLKSLLRRERFDIIHSQHAHMPDLLFRQINREMPIITTVHTTIQGQREAIEMARRMGSELERSEVWQIVLGPVLSTAERLTLRRSGYYITVSRWMREHLVSSGLPPSRVSVVYNGVDANRFRPSQDPRDAKWLEDGGPLVLFSGRPTSVKGVETLLTAIPDILSEVSDCRFVFTGGEEAEFRRLLVHHHVPQSCLRIIGYVSHNDLPAVYAAADVAVLPTFYENLPLRLLEVMACGVPVVASNVCAIPEVIRSGYNGLLVTPGSATQLADAVVTLLTQEQLRRTIGERARRSVVDAFSWSKAAKETVKAYEAAMGVTA